MLLEQMVGSWMVQGIVSVLPVCLLTARQVEKNPENPVSKNGGEGEYLAFAGFNVRKKRVKD